MLPLTGLSVSLILAFKLYGFDRHVWDVRPPILVNSRKITMALEALYLVSTSLTKISILLFIRRLAHSAVSMKLRIAVYGAILFVILYFLAYFILLFLACRPIAAFWMQADFTWSLENEGKYHCIDEAAQLISAAGVSAAQDFIACGLPMVLFWKARIPRRQKIALALVFGVGFIVCVIGVLRIVSTAPIYYTTYDMTWAVYPAWIWFAVESNVSVMCASAPALKIYFKEVLSVSSAVNYFRRKSKVGSGGSDPTFESELSEIPAPSHHNQNMDFKNKEAWLITTDSEMSQQVGGPDVDLKEPV